MSDEHCHLCGKPIRFHERDGMPLYCDDVLVPPPAVDSPPLLVDAREIDMLLENEFGGFYLSAPTGTPLAKVRGLLRGGRP